MDGRNVIWKFYEARTKYGSDFEIAQQSNIGSCSCITHHSVFQRGAATSLWNLKQIWKGMWEIFH